VPFDPHTHTFTRPDGSRVFSVTQILAKAGICDYSAVPQANRDRGMRRGTSVHWLTQLDDQGALDYRTVPKSLRPYRKAYRTWVKRSGFNCLLIEQEFMRDDFAGIVDRAGTFPATTMYYDGSKAVLDIKTGTALQDWVKYQLCAYSVGIEPRIGLAKFIRRIALLLRPDGTYSIKEYPLCTWDLDYATFRKAVQKAYEI
jgi:hypothetical protein